MSGRRAIQDRESDEEAAILEALLERGEEGMSVLELRASVDADIDAIEASLTELKREGLIEVGEHDGTNVIKPDESVIPGLEEDAPDDSVFDRIEEVWDSVRDRLSL